MKAKEEELRKAQAEVTQLEGELIKSHDAAAVEALELKAKLKATEGQAKKKLQFLQFQNSRPQMR